MEIHKKLKQLESVEERLAAKKIILLNQAYHSTNPNDLIKANSVAQKAKNSNITPHEEVDRKAYLLDPYQFNSFMGYKDKPYSLSYQMLKKMSYGVPIVRSIIGTRIDQVANFCEVQKDKYSIGFVIRKKAPHYPGGESSKLTREEIQKIEEITEFILNCGVDSNSFDNDDFDTFVRKIINDSLTYDQMTFEVTRNEFTNKPTAFYAIDASTMRIADSYDQNVFENKDRRNVDRIEWDRNNNITTRKKYGYYPKYCQIKDSVSVADFYPWEMSFGIRNPTTDIYANGYGVSEIEILTNTITSMLWSDEYNRRFFSQGSAPKGLLKVKAGTSLNPATLSQFKQQWQAMMSGVYNSWKTPILEGDIDWVDLQKSNNDMEFAKWQEYLIKLSTSIFRIDPSEINFPLSGGSGDRLFGTDGGTKERIQNSKDKGLYPLLKFLQRKINKYIVSQIDPRFEFSFQGLDVEDPKTELDADIKMLGNFMTLDEVRVKRGLKPLGPENGGNIICNSIWMQNKNAEEQKKMMEQQQQQGGGSQSDEEQEPNPNDANQDEEDQAEEEGIDEGDVDSNPFQKAFDNYLDTLRK